ncbi:MAG TPA: hypothetical protein P5556_10850 [Candidatus Gastranaerophilales bacterium]|nr:hypothetical protein [Candidatus Gastranaerophilales bacterium]
MKLCKSALYLVILVGILILSSQKTFAEEYMLPKSFSIEKSTISLEDLSSQKPAQQINITVKSASQTPQNIKQVTLIKKNAVVANISLTDLIQNFNDSYSKTLESTMTTLAQFNIEPLFYDSSKGQIKAKLISGKEIFILLLPSREKLTHVRITPADGRYNLSKELVSEIFINIQRNLYNDINLN